MNQQVAKKVIEDTKYLENRILVYDNGKKANKFCKIVWKGYSATFKDQNNEDGTVRVRLRDMLSGKEFSEDISDTAKRFSKEAITDRESSKKEILNILNSTDAEQTKTLEWVTGNLSKDKLQEDQVEELLTELWLESKVTKARFKSDDLVVYNSRK